MNKSILENFIVFEGLDGAGTTTQCKLLYNYLKEKNIDVLLDAEPTPSPIGHLIRTEYLSKNSKTTPWALALLYAADRENHINNVDNGLKTLIKSGKTIISDRYLYSSLAYQSVNLDINKVKSINNFEEPEFVIYIDTPVEECLNRISVRGAKTELFEKRDYLEKTRDGFENAFRTINPNTKFIRIDGTRTKEEIFKQVVNFYVSNKE